MGHASVHGVYLYRKPLRQPLALLLSAAFLLPAFIPYEDRFLKSYVSRDCFVFRPDLITVGNDCRVHMGCLLDGRRGIIIGDHVDISFFVKIFSLQHDLDDL